MKEITSWTVALSVGNRQVDDRHKNLFRLGQETFWLLKESNDDVKRANAVLVEIAEAMWECFAVEEEILGRNAFPHLEEHKWEHQLFRAQIHDVIRQCESNILDRFALFEVMRSWMWNHVWITDSSCKGYFAEASLSITNRDKYQPSG